MRYRRVFSFAIKFWISKNAERMQPLSVSMIDRSIRLLSFFCLQAILRDPLLLVAMDMLEQLILRKKFKTINMMHVLQHCSRGREEKQRCILVETH